MKKSVIKKCNVIFIHVPKAAGTSINDALYGKSFGHFTSLEIERLFPKLFECCFKFSIVRNPWDRLVSAYEFAKMGGTKDTILENPKQYDIPEFETFETFVLNWLVKEDLTKLDYIFRPQHMFVTNQDGNINIDYVGKLEKLTEAQDKILKATGITLNIGIKNKSRKSNGYESYYENPIVRGTVERLYERDIKLFDYKFKG